MTTFPNTFSTRLHIPRPIDSDTPPDLGPIFSARDAIIDTFVPITSGVMASRPVSTAISPGIVGRFYLSTDAPFVNMLWFDYGIGWMQLGQGLPAGLIMEYGGSTAPAGWLICDSTPYSRTTYANLFAAIGTTYGTGNGSTTFNVPDFRGRSPLGVGTGTGVGATAWGLGTQPPTGVGGEQTHHLTEAEMPSHSHGGSTQNDTPDHSHSTAAVATGNQSADHQHTFFAAGKKVPAADNWFTNNVNVGGTVTAQGVLPTAGAVPAVGSTDSQNTSHTHTVPLTTSGGANSRHTHPISPDGSDAFHNNMHPISVVNFIIKY